MQQSNYTQDYLGTSMAPSTERGVYEKALLKMYDGISPRLLVVSSHRAKQLCNMNFLTPAEFLATYATKLRSEDDLKVFSVMKEDQAIFSNFSRNKRFRLVDLEEWKPVNDMILDLQMTRYMQQIEPKTEDIDRLDFSDGVPPNLLDAVHNELAYDMLAGTLRTLPKEHDLACFNECCGVVIMVDAKEYTDNLNLIKSIEDHYSSQINIAIGANNQINNAAGAVTFDRKFPRMVIFLNDKDLDTEDSEIESMLKITFRPDYQPSCFSYTVIRINGHRKNGEEPEHDFSSIWTPDMLYPKIETKFYTFPDTEGVGGQQKQVPTKQMDVNSPGLRRGCRLNKSPGVDSYPRTIRTKIFTDAMSKILDNQLKNFKEIASEKKKGAKRSFMGISIGIFKKDDQPVLDSQGRTLHLTQDGIT